MTASVGDIPSGWLVTWCGRCGYSATFNEEVAVSYGPDWPLVFEEACDHECDEMEPPW